MFSYYEYIGNNYNADMKAIGDTVTKEWWKLTDPMQEPLPKRKAGEWWAVMDQPFCLDKIVAPSVGAGRFGLTADIIPGKEDEIIRLLKNLPVDLENETYKHNFQNCNMFSMNGKLYYYYEYVGSNYRNDITELSQTYVFKNFQNNLNNCLVQKNGQYWQVMKEVFHTN